MSLPHYLMMPPWLLVSIEIVVCWTALMVGGWRERVVSCGIFIPTAVEAVFCLPPDYCWDRGALVRISMSVAADSFTVLTCVVAIWRADRYWPIFAGALALSSLLTNAVGLAFRVEGMWTLVLANQLWCLLLQMTLTWAVVNRLRRRNA